MNDNISTVWEFVWTAQEEAVVAAMVADGKSNAEIAQALNRTPSQVSGKVTRLGLNGARRPQRKKPNRRLMVSNYSRLALVVEARKRGMTVQDLEARLLDIIARERLVDAILDDSAEAAE